jgi:putative transposase
MPCYPRKHQLAGSLMYHDFNRSNAGAIIFHDNADYEKFMALLRRYVDAYSLKIYHWAIMSTHFHLLFELINPRLISKFMAGLTVIYTRYHHARYRTHGFLWQGRFKLQPVQKEGYLIACGRYIERNPVESGICVAADHYPYSSARFYTQGIGDGITVEDPTYINFGTCQMLRQEKYRYFLRESGGEEEKLFGEMEAVAGNPSFIERLKLMNGRPIPQGTGKSKRDFLASIACPPKR